MTDWPSYLMGFAAHAAAKSKDSTKVGAALVNDRRRVLCTGFNGPPAGVRDTPERFVRPTKYLYAAHAEANLIATAASEGIRTAGLTAYVTHFPCSSCAKLLIQAGIVRVVHGAGATSMPLEEFEAARAMFCEAGVNVEDMSDCTYAELPETGGNNAGNRRGSRRGGDDWPTGCKKLSSCARNKRCMYNCAHSARDISEEVAAAIRALKGGE